VTDRFKPLLDRQFLKAELDYEFRDYLASGEDERLNHRLEQWAKRELKRETQAEGSFVQRFFIETWGFGTTASVQTFFTFGQSLRSPVPDRPAGRAKPTWR